MWEEVAPFAFNKFSIWANGGGRYWAEHAWNFIVKAGLADHKDEIERHIVLIRLMTLATMYLEFCDLVWDEYFEREDIVKEEWLEDGNLFNSIRIWQIVGTDFYRDEEIGSKEKTILLTEALNGLIDKYRKEVYEALVKGFGNDENLFFSMLLSQHMTDAEGFDETTYGNDCELSREEHLGLSWVYLGMPASPKECV